MSTDELERAIRDQLRVQAAQRPAAAATKLAVMRAVADLAHAVPERNWRRWTLPILAAAAVVLLAVCSIVLPKALRGQPARPAAPISSTVPSPSASPTPSPSGAGTSTKSAAVADNWFKGIPFGSFPHVAGLCPAGRSPVASLSPGTGLPVAGEPYWLFMLQVACTTNLFDSNPEPVEIFAYSPSGPKLLQVLAYQPGDPRALVDSGYDFEGSRLTLTESGYAPGDSTCCRSLLFTQTFRWQPRTGTQAHGHFVAGPQVNAVKPCTAEQLQVTTSPLSSQSGDAAGLLVKYTNINTVPCTLRGYPTASAVDAAGHLLVTARQSASGFFGGLASGSAAPPIVTLLTRTASAVIEWSAAAYTQGSSCYQAARISSAPPQTTASRSFGAPARICDLQVHPVVAGSTGKG